MRRAKITVPLRPPGFVERPSVRAALEAQSEPRGRGRVVLVSAPAGYGKTVAVTDWVRADPDVADGVAGAGRGGPGRGRVVALRDRRADGLPGRGRGQRAPPACTRPSWPTARARRAFLATVLEALDDLPDPVRLVLDDVHDDRRPGACRPSGSSCALVPSRSGPHRSSCAAGTTHPSDWIGSAWTAGCVRCGSTGSPSPSRGHRAAVRADVDRSDHGTDRDVSSHAPRAGSPRCVWWRGPCRARPTLPRWCRTSPATTARSPTTWWTRSCPSSTIGSAASSRPPAHARRSRWNWPPC